MLLSRFGLCCSIHCAQENDLHSDLTAVFAIFNLFGIPEEGSTSLPNLQLLAYIVF